MKTLFLKSNTLHIRTNEGEFEVSNPDEIGCFNSTGMFYIWNSGNGDRVGTDNEVEWPYGVKIVCTHGCKTGYDCDEIRGCNLVARLIPEEKKKPVFIPEDHLFASTGRASKFYETKTESAYKEGEKCTTCGKAKEESHYCSNSFHLSAPSESQEELWGEVFDLLETLDIPVNSENRGLHSEVTESLIKKKFTITRKPE